MKFEEIVFKVLSAGLLPALIWVNSLSVDIAILKKQVESHETSISTLKEEQKSIHDGVKENQASLRELNVSIIFMKDILTDIREELKKK